MGESARVRVPLLEALAVQAQAAFSDSGRSLNSQEKKLLLTIFQDSVNLDTINIVLTDLGTKGRPYTLGNTIRVPRGTTFDAETLVHEMTHVWQYQTRGTSYISDSALHQLAQGAAAYVVELVPGQSFYGYTAEQEAMIVQRYYEDTPPGWRENEDVVRMIGEIRKARPLASTEIQQETWFGPNRGLPESAPGSGIPKQPQTVPLIRIEF